MSTENNNNNENQKSEATVIETSLVKESKIDNFSKTSTAANLSGAFNQTAGLLKRKIGELTHDTSLNEAGREQQLLGKVHRLVGKVRGVREAVQEKISTSRMESLSLVRRHGGRLIDVASDLVDDVKKTLLK
ncbi:MAG: CsbD family protein [Pseudobdellovibrio sp.]